ncbi:hypothetical protein LCGC14_2144310, partial [marine sediment metagenome]
MSDHILKARALKKHFKTGGGMLAASGTV